MKAHLVPLHFSSDEEPAFVEQTRALKHLLGDVAEILEPVALGSELPAGADAVDSPSSSARPSGASARSGRWTSRSSC